MKSKKRTATLDAPKRFISTFDAARTCGVSVFSVQRWFDEGLLRGAKLPGGRRLIDPSSLDQFMRKHALKSSERGSDVLRVLVVEDDPPLLEILKDCLAAAGGFIVETATGGLSAGLKIADFRPHCLVLDVMLEDVPGPTIVREIRQSQVGAAMRIIAISGKAMDKDIEEVMDAGANAYLQKPFKMEVLVKSLRMKRTIRP